MPLLGFSVLLDKLELGLKCQTIRLPRKRPFKVGDKLFIYWKPRTKECYKIGEGVVTKITRKEARYLTEEEAVKDGFKAKYGLSAKGNLVRELNRLHPDMTENTQVDVITWNWLNVPDSIKGDEK